MNRLNIGSGYVMPPDWTNVDTLDYGNNIVADLLTGLPFEDGYFDYVLSNHQLQMIRFDDLPHALAELRRVLKVGGVLRILVPNMQWVLDMWREGVVPGDFPISHGLEPTIDGSLLRYMFWHGDARSAFTYRSLADTLIRNGFQSVQLCDFEQTHSEYAEIVDLDSREAESIVAEAIR